MSAKAIIITVVVALIGGGYILLADIGPLKGMNLGFGLTAGLSQSIGVPGGYNMADVVMFVIFVVLIAIAFFVLRNMRNKTGK